MSTAEFLHYMTKRGVVGISKLDTGPIGDCAESDLQQSIEDYLKSLGKECWYVRQRMDKPTGQRVGVPDFIGWYQGQPFAIEVKVKGRKPSPEQTGEIYWAALAGARTGVAYSLEDAIRILLGDEPK